MAKEKENRQVEEIPPQELDNYLSRFLLSVRKKKGDEYLFFTVLCRAPSLHWSILNNELHLSGSRLYGMVLVYGMADSCLYNKQNNTWTLGDMEFIFSCSHLIPHSFDIDINTRR